VDKYSTVVINQNHYSVPEGNVGKYIKAKVGAKNIKLFIDGQLEAMHIRNWGVHQWVMHINHFLKTFQRKKGAIAQSECLRQAPTQIKNIYYQHYIGKEKEFLELLLYVKENDNLNQVLEAIKDLENIRLDYVSTERILFICEQSLPTESATTRRDDTINQSESNMIAYTKMFGQLKEVASS
uniref:Mu transposase domain-containing protein n=1 Tax=Staphylococcus epidermidis TaxID=1282 RepID=UPI0037D9D6FA